MSHSRLYHENVKCPKTYSKILGLHNLAFMGQRKIIQSNMGSKE